MVGDWEGLKQRTAYRTWRVIGLVLVCGVLHTAWSAAHEGIQRREIIGLLVMSGLALGCGACMLFYAWRRNSSSAHDLTLINCAIVPTLRADARMRQPDGWIPGLRPQREYERDRYASSRVWAFLWGRQKYRVLFEEVFRTDTLLSAEIIEELLFGRKTAIPVLRIWSESDWEFACPGRNVEAQVNTRLSIPGSHILYNRQLQVAHPETRLVLCLMALLQHSITDIEVRSLVKMALRSKTKTTRELGIRVMGHHAKPTGVVASFGETGDAAGVTS